MRAAHVVQIATPKRVVLDGLWLGPIKVKRVIIFVHGLGSSLFSKLDIAYALIDKETAVLAFNNRGHDKVARVTRGKKRVNAGAAFEVFTDCIDDIEGAINAARASGAKDIYLAGHSTGCQKSIYWAAKKKNKKVKGIILLAPISDYAAQVFTSGKTKVVRAVGIAKQMVRAGKGDALVPQSVWDETLSAQRLVSLYSGESAEEIYPYWAPERMPTTLKKVKLPVLVLLAGEDQYNDRSAKTMAQWFSKHVRNWRDITIVKNVDHSFTGGEEVVVRHMRSFFREAGTK